MPALPAKSTLDGTKVPATKVSEMKTAMAGLYDYLAGLLGSSGAVSDARNVLNVPDKDEVNLRFALTQGFKNTIVNGDMVIAQRGVSFTGIATTPIYTLDRWRVSQATSNTLTVSQDSDVPTSKVLGASLAVTVTGTADTAIAAGDFSNLGYSVEGFDARRFAGKTFTLSFWVKSSLTGTYTVALQNTGTATVADRSYLATYTVNAANTWERKTITVVNGLPNTVGTWNFTNGIGIQIRFSLAAGTNFQNATTSSWLTGNLLATPSQVNFVGTAGNVLKLTDVQLELGTSATDYEQLPYAVQLARCQRYYHVQTLYTIQYGAAGNILGGTVSLPVSIRATVTPTFNASYGNASGLTNVSTSTNILAYQFTVTATGTATVNATATIDAEL